MPVPGSCRTLPADAPAVHGPFLNWCNRYGTKLFSDLFRPHGHVVMVPVRAFHADAVHRVAEEPELVCDRFWQEIERDFACLQHLTLRHNEELTAPGASLMEQKILVTVPTDRQK